jgi:hypothetical protein
MFRRIHRHHLQGYNNPHLFYRGCITITIAELYHTEDGGDMFSETSGVTRATRCNIAGDIRHSYRRENISEDSLLWPYIISIFILIQA